MFRCLPCDPLFALASASSPRVSCSIQGRWVVAAVDKCPVNGMLAGLRFFPSAGAVGAGRGQTGEKNSREGSRESSRPSPEGGTRHDTGKSKESGESRTQVVRIENRDFFKEKLDKAAGEQRGGRKTDGNPPRAEGEESGGTRTAAGVARGHQRASASLPSGLQSSGNAQPNEATLESGPSPLHIRELNPFLREQYLSKQNRGEEVRSGR